MDDNPTTAACLNCGNSEMKALLIAVRYAGDWRFKGRG